MIPQAIVMSMLKLPEALAFDVRVVHHLCFDLTSYASDTNTIQAGHLDMTIFPRRRLNCSRRRRRRRRRGEQCSSSSLP
jgi:hypothetical protein